MDHLFQDVPHLRPHFFNRALGRFDVIGDAKAHQLLHHKGLEQLQRHLLGQAALVELELRPHHDDRAPGIVHALAQQVLTEAALLAPEEVAK